MSYLLFLYRCSASGKSKIIAQGINQAQPDNSKS